MHRASLTLRVQSRISPLLSIALASLAVVGMTAWKASTDTDRKRAWSKVVLTLLVFVFGAAFWSDWTSYQNRARTDRSASGRSAHEWQAKTPEERWSLRFLTGATAAASGGLGAAAGMIVGPRWSTGSRRPRREP